MEANGKSAFDLHGFNDGPKTAGQENSALRAKREKNRFWIEQPARRFVVYFCALVTAETMVVSTLHWIFHLV